MEQQFVLQFNAFSLDEFYEEKGTPGITCGVSVPLTMNWEESKEKIKT